MKIGPPVPDLPRNGNARAPHTRKYASVLAAARAARGQWVPVRFATAKAARSAYNSIRGLEGIEQRTRGTALYVRAAA